MKANQESAGFAARAVLAAAVAVGWAVSCGGGEFTASPQPGVLDTADASIDAASDTSAEATGQAGQAGQGGAGHGGQAGEAGQAGSGDAGSAGLAGAGGQAGEAGQAGSGDAGSAGLAGAGGQAGTGAGGVAGLGGQAGAAGLAGVGGADAGEGGQAGVGPGGTGGLGGSNAGGSAGAAECTRPWSCVFGDTQSYCGGTDTFAGCPGVLYRCHALFGEDEAVPCDYACREVSGILGRQDECTEGPGALLDICDSNQDCGAGLTCTSTYRCCVGSGWKMPDAYCLSIHGGGCCGFGLLRRRQVFFRVAANRTRSGGCKRRCRVGGSGSRGARQGGRRR